MKEPSNLTELLARAKEGDSSVLSEIFESMRPGLERWIAFRFGDHLKQRLDVEDIVQETMVAGTKGLASFEYREQGAFAKWLRTIAENRLRDANTNLHAQKRDPAREQQLERSLHGSWSSASGEVRRNEDRERLLEMVASLTGSQREIIRLIRFDGMSYAQAGEVLRISEKAAGVRLTRALLALKSAYDNPSTKTIWG